MTPRRLVGACVVAVLIAVCLAAPGQAEEKQKAKDLLVGKWKHSKTEDKGDVKVEFEMTIDFMKDGKVKVGANVKFGDKEVKHDMDGTYKWVDVENIELTVKEPKTKKEETKKLKVKVSEKELELTDKSEKDKDKATLKFTRVK
jgi:uncharacterized protein (TIGR03066 family)